MNFRTHKITVISMFCALSLLAVICIRIPIFLPFLTYSPKDALITIGGLIFGPLTALIISLITAFLEMITVSDTGILGCIMNFLASSAFACIVTYTYRRYHTKRGAVVGLVFGTVVMTAFMLLWNFCLAPIYMGCSREAVVKLMLPAFLPFNIIKGVVNSVLIMVLYKPVIMTLRKRYTFLQQPTSPSPVTERITYLLLILILLITGITYFIARHHM